MLSLTYLDPRTRELQPLLQLENELASAITFRDKSLTEVQLCTNLIHSLQAFHFNQFELRVHRRVLVLLKELANKTTELGKELPSMRTPLFVLNKLSCSFFNALMEAHGISKRRDFWADLMKYKKCLREVPVQLCYIATEQNIMQLKQKQLSPSQQSAFEYCSRLRSSEEFVAHTNVRQKACDELQNHLVNRRIGNFFDEYINLDEYIANIYHNFVPIRLAWAYTLLSDVTVNQEVNESCMSETPTTLSDASSVETVVSAAGHLAKLVDPVAECQMQQAHRNHDNGTTGEAAQHLISKRQKHNPVLDTSCQTTHDDSPWDGSGSSEINRVSLNQQRLVRNVLQEMKTELYYKVDEFIEYAEVQLKRQHHDGAQMGRMVSEFFQNFRFSSNDIAPIVKDEKHLASPIAGADTADTEVPIVLAENNIKVAADNHNSTDSEDETVANPQIKSEPLSQTSNWSQSVEITESVADEVIEIEDDINNTQDLIDILQTPGMGSEGRLFDKADLLSDLPSTPTAEPIESVGQVLTSPITPLNTIGSDDQVLSTPIPPVSTITSDGQVLSSPISADEIHPVQLPSPANVAMPARKANADHIKHYFDNPLETTQIIKHNFAPLPVSVASDQAPGTARRQTARRGRNRSGAADRYVNSKRRGLPQLSVLDTDVLIEDASLCVSPHFSDESQQQPIPDRNRDDHQFLSQVQDLPNASSLINHLTPNCIAIPPDTISTDAHNTAPDHSVVSLQSSLFTQPYLKLNNFSGATVTAQNDAQCSVSVSYPAHYGGHLNEPSARLLLQLPLAAHWAAFRGLCANCPSSSYTFDVFEPRYESKARLQPIGEQVLAMLFRTRNYIRDGLAVVQANGHSDQSEVLRLNGTAGGDTATCVDKALSPNRLEEMKMMRRAKLMQQK